MNSQIRNGLLIGAALALLFGSRAIANFVIEYQWWQELGQLETWASMLLYRVLPAAVASVLAWFVLLWAHRGGASFAGVQTSDFSLYRRIVPVALLALAVLFCGSSIDAWTVMAYVGSLGIELSPDAWQDPVFDKTLPFYLFRLPFYSLLLKYVFIVAVFATLVFWAAGRGWQIFEKVRSFRAGGGSMEEFDPGPNPLMLPGATRTSFAKILASIGLLAVAVWFFLARYSLLMNEHDFMTGVDYVDDNVTLPLRWVVILAAIVAIPLVAQARLKLAVGILGGALIGNSLLPEAVAILYVRPNELDLERTYIARHIEATTEAFGLQTRARSESFEASADTHLDTAAHATLIENIRLWDSQAFASTIAQIQALRPYYRFPGIDIDRYMMNGRIKQVLLSPREIDVAALPPAAKERWINPHFFYTHGYGVVMSEVNRTTDDGLPVLLVQDAPPVINTPDIRLERPEIYYGEYTHDPVFVNTDQKEFDYPSGDQNITSSYGGSGGFPIHSILLRLAAAISQAEYNILLTGLTNENSRMMLYRNVSERLAHLAGFLHWEPDPYLVITDEGRLVWIVDGYTSSASHPYSAHLNVPVLGGNLNYVRNSVKATIDAYDGTTKIYVFDPSDPILQAYRGLFPNLFHEEADMPSSERAHARYPQLLFEVQAQVYRTFHMRDPDVFYNKEDVWDVAQSLFGDTGTAAAMRPTYIVARVPGESEPEFLLMLPFTPRGKDNLIGWMAARCDGDELGELIFFQLSKQQLVFGPNQIESRINQDQNIAKDLTLWNQQGSRVLRGDILALPVAGNFLYVESIYIQAETARMPQLKKVVLAMGNRLIYEDTFEAALQKLEAPTDLALFGEEAVDEDGARSRPEGIRADSTSVSPAQLRQLAQRLRQLRQQAEGLAEELGQLQDEVTTSR